PGRIQETDARAPTAAPAPARTTRAGSQAHRAGCCGECADLTAGDCHRTGPAGHTAHLYLLRLRASATKDRVTQTDNVCHIDVASLSRSSGTPVRDVSSETPELTGFRGASRPGRWGKCPG